jgi:hypothetical protein
MLVETLLEALISLEPSSKEEDLIKKIPLLALILSRIPPGPRTAVPFSNTMFELITRMRLNNGLNV